MAKQASLVKNCMNCHQEVEWSNLSKYLLVDKQEFFLCKPCNHDGRVCFSCGLLKPLTEFRLHFKGKTPFFSALCEACGPVGLIETPLKIHIFGINDLDVLENEYHLKKEILATLEKESPKKLSEKTAQENKTSTEAFLQEKTTTEKSWLQTTKENATLIAAAIKSNFNKEANTQQSNTTRENIHKAIERIRKAGMGIEKQRRAESHGKAHQQSSSMSGNEFQEIPPSEAEAARKKQSTFLSNTTADTNSTNDLDKIGLGGQRDTVVKNSLFKPTGDNGSPVQTSTNTDTQTFRLTKGSPGSGSSSK